MARLGKGFRVTSDGKVVKGRRRKSVSDQIRERKSRKPRVVSRMKAMAKGQQP